MGAVGNHSGSCVHPARLAVVSALRGLQLDGEFGFGSRNVLRRCMPRCAIDQREKDRQAKQRQ